MNEQEKARELVAKYEEQIDAIWFHEVYNSKIVKDTAKQCALICVEFSIQNLPTSIDNRSKLHELQNVKSEIKKI